MEFNEYNEIKNYWGLSIGQAIAYGYIVLAI